VIRRYQRAFWPLAVVLSISACGPRAAAPAVAAGPKVVGPVATSSSAPAGPAAAVVTVSVPDGATVTPTQRVHVSVAGGVLQTVTLTAADGAVVASDSNVGSWTAPADLPPLQRFTLDVKSANAAGTATDVQQTFTTSAPTTELKTDVYPFGDMTVGIAAPIIVTLNHAVPTSARADVERALTVQSDVAYGEGSWAWLSSTELHFRPAEFWPAHAHITVHVDLANVHVGPGFWGMTNRDVTFQTGRAMVLRVNDATHLMTVSIDGTQVRTIPVSLGKKGFETRSGIKVISEKFTSYHMQSSTIGVSDKKDPNYYDVTVPYAMRITNSGEFIHGAPWNKLIGKADASHGCTNVALADAIWLFNRVLPGDPVITTGTVKPMEGWNGLGAEWNYSYAFWKSLSAL
jgi:lipoprotein-anchoring transpeptidase ErfK/SrfK